MYHPLVATPTAVNGHSDKMLAAVNATLCDSMAALLCWAVLGAEMQGGVQQVAPAPLPTSFALSSHDRGWKARECSSRGTPCVPCAWRCLACLRSRPTLNQIKESLSGLMYTYEISSMKFEGPWVRTRKEVEAVYTDLKTRVTTDFNELEDA